MVNDPNFKQHGQHKVITVKVAFNAEDILAGKVTGQYWGYHKYVPITNNTTFEEYWGQVKDNVTSKFMDNLYDDQVPKFLSVRIKNVDHLANTTITEIRDKKGKITFKVQPKSPVSVQKRSFHSTPLFNKSYQKHITPIKTKNTVIPKSFSTLDVETISLNNTEVPVAISLVLVDHNLNPELDKYFFTIDKSRLKYENGNVDMEALNLEVQKMWIRLHKTLVTRASVGCEAVKYIFVHNLGAFDGYFIFKYLNKFFKKEHIYTIIDKQNKFITMTFTVDKCKTDIKFLDSYRIFPVGLQELCEVFGVSGKTMKYSSDFHSLSVFHTKDLFNKLKEYSIQDSVCLHSALMSAQDLYLSTYNVDITTIVSASSLAFKIFRTQN